MKSIKYCLFLVAFLLSPLSAHGFPNFDECSRFFTYLAPLTDTLSLDERPVTARKNYGISVRTRADGNFIVDKINPDLFYELREKGTPLISNDIITKINQKDSKTIEAQNFLEESDSNKVEVEVNGKQTITLEKKDFYSFELDVAIDFLSLSEINSKFSQADANLILHSWWYDERMSEIGHKVLVEASKTYPEALDSTFYCDVPNAIKKILETPVIEIENFVPELQPTEISYQIHYTPKEGCKPTGSSCTETEKKYGFVQLVRAVKYSGTFVQNFDFRQFPFDKQKLILSLSSKDHAFQVMEGYLHHTSIQFGEYAQEMQKLSLSKIANDSWKLKKPFHEYGLHESFDLDTSLPNLQLGVEIERKSIFYLFKIFAPIFFILVIALSSLWISPKELESRLTISVVCLLSLIAYNYIVDQEIPKLGYITYLDKFVFISYLFAGLPILQTVFISSIWSSGNFERAKHIDSYSRWALPASIVLTYSIVTLSSLY